MFWEIIAIIIFTAVCLSLFDRVPMSNTEIITTLLGVLLIVGGCAAFKFWLDHRLELHREAQATRRMEMVAEVGRQYEQCTEALGRYEARLSMLLKKREE